MLILKELRFSRIGRFIEEQSISFDNFGNIIQVDGQNNNTGGSSGAGKSTIFNAIDFLFGLNSVPNSVLQSRLTEDSISVEGDFDYDGQKLTISRAKKLKITINDEVTTGSAKLTEEKLDQIIDIPRNLFRQMLHKKQGEKGFFLNLTPRETNDFLTDCLGLNDYAKYLDRLDVKRIDLSKMIGSLDASIKVAESALNASKNGLNHLGAIPERTIGQDTILALKAKVDLSQKNLNDLKAIHAKQKEDLNSKRPSIEVKSFDTSKKDELKLSLDNNNLAKISILNEINKKKLEFKEKIHSINDEIKNNENKGKKGVEARSAAVKLALELKKIKESTCPTCEQNWATENSKTKETELLTAIESHKKIIAEGETSLSLVPNLKVKLEELNNESSQLDSYPGIIELHNQETELKKLYQIALDEEKDFLNKQNEINRQLQKEFHEELTKLSNEHTRDMEGLQEQLKNEEKKLNNAVSTFKYYNESVQRYNTALKSFTEEIEKLEISLKEKKAEYEKYNEEFGYVEELYRAIKSYLSCSFDEALEAIGETASKLIQGIPNMSTGTIQLQGIRETKDGKVKEEVNAQLHIDGEQNVDLRSLSGGERASTDLAIDLAVIELIETRTNKGINIFILDEPFNGLESVNIEMVLEMLKNMNVHKKLLIVDHNPIVKEQISDKITIVRDGLTSKVQ